MRFLILPSVFSSREYALHPHRRKLLAYPGADLGQDRSSRLRFRCDAYFRTRSSVNSDFANGEEISFAVSLPSFRKCTCEYSTRVNSRKVEEGGGEGEGELKR